MREKTRQYIFRNFWHKLPMGALLGTGATEVRNALKTFLIPYVEPLRAMGPISPAAQSKAADLARNFCAERGLPV